MAHPVPALRKHLNRAQTFEELHDAVSADVQRAAQLIDAGLNSLALGQRN
ncbi:hypothetical protein [Streptomyces sp. NPDC001307]